ncbi:hypothetical protein EVAR_62885_1 [Eumeta japonica]|uniref:Uncharacterized protein n=1 Tax=Eumeta variegata TaxID=151549 RepID=A0A4C1ZWN3_EUMVA|nr:hypothetical protein EVAR_62885_1 [Eumeta japonica]
MKNVIPDEPGCAEVSSEEVVLQNLELMECVWVGVGEDWRRGAPAIVFDLLYASLYFALEGSRSRSVLGCRICDRAAQGCGFSSYQFANIREQTPAI